MLRLRPFQYIIVLKISRLTQKTVAYSGAVLKIQLGLGLYTVAQDIRPIHSKIFTRARRYLYFK